MLIARETLPPFMANAILDFHFLEPLPIRCNTYSKSPREEEFKFKSQNILSNHLIMGYGAKFTF